VSTIWGTIKLHQTRSSVTVDDYDWGFGQILPVVLLIGPIVMAAQAILHSIIQKMPIESSEDVMKATHSPDAQQEPAGDDGSYILHQGRTLIR